MHTAIRSYAKLSTVQLKLFMREPLAFFFTLVFPLLVLLLYGAIWGNQPGSAQMAGEYGYIDAMVPALMGMIVGTVALLSVPVATATAREQHLLRRYQATPLRAGVYMAADVTIYSLVGFISVALLIAVARLVFDLRLVGSLWAVAGAFSLSLLSFMAVGYLIAALAPTGRVAQVAGQVLFFPMLFLSGASIPLALMPENVQQVSRWLPLTHVVGLLQSLWFGGGWDMRAVAVMLGMLVVGTVLSVRLLRWE